MTPFEHQPHLVSIGLPDSYTARFRKTGFPHVKTREYPSFPIFEIFECTHPVNGVIDVRSWTRLVILDLISNSEHPLIPLQRQAEQVNRVFPKARIWCLTDSEDDMSTCSYEVGVDLDEDISRKIIGFTPYVDEEGNTLDPTAFYRKAMHLAFPGQFSY
jgi:hypothetical protein